MEAIIGEVIKPVLERVIGWLANRLGKGRGLRLQDERDIARILEFREIASKVQAVYLAWPNWKQAERIYEQYHPALREITAVFTDPQDPGRMRLHEAMAAFTRAFARCCVCFDPGMEAPHEEKVKDMECLQIAYRRFMDASFQALKKH